MHYTIYYHPCKEISLHIYSEFLLQSGSSGGVPGFSGGKSSFSGEVDGSTVGKQSSTNGECAPKNKEEYKNEHEKNYR